MLAAAPSVQSLLAEIAGTSETDPGRQRRMDFSSLLVSLTVFAIE
jgi:hypothetical protein